MPDGSRDTQDSAVRARPRRRSCLSKADFILKRSWSSIKASTLRDSEIVRERLERSKSSEVEALPSLARSGNLLRNRRAQDTRGDFAAPETAA
jgi:hypothetical protein